MWEEDPADPRPRWHRPFPPAPLTRTGAMEARCRDWCEARAALKAHKATRRQQGFAAAYVARDKVVDVLTWAFYRSFQEAINEGNSSLLCYSTADNSTRCAAEIRNYTGNTYDLGNFQAVSDPASIKYTDGQVIYIAVTEIPASRTCDAGRGDVVSCRG